MEIEKKEIILKKMWKSGFARLRKFAFLSLVTRVATI